MKELDIFIKNLKSEDEEIRRQAIDMIGELCASAEDNAGNDFSAETETDDKTNVLPDENKHTIINRVIENLAKQIESENWRLRKSIVEAFKKINNPLCLPVLSKIIKDSHIDVHSTAIDALIHFGKKSIPYVLPYLSDSDPDARILSANILGFIKSPISLKDLIRRLSVENNMNVKYAIIEALGNIGSEKSVDIMLSMLDVEDIYLKIILIESLGKIGSMKACPQLMSFLEDEMIRGLCIDALGNIGADISINSILEYFDTDEEVNSKIVAAIANIYKKSSKSGEDKNNYELIKGICRQFFKKYERYEQLISILKTTDMSLKNDALQILGWIDNIKLTHELIILIEDPDFKDKIREMLIRIGYSIISDIIKEFHKTESLTIKRVIIEILGIIGSEKESEFLMNLLKSPDSKEIEEQIIYSLGWLRCESSVGLIVKFLNSDNESLHSAAVGALSIIGNNEVIEYCKTNIKSNNLYTKKGCIKTLGYIGDPANISILKEVDVFESKEIKIAYIDAISYISDKTGIDLIVKFLNEPDNEIKEHIVTALTRINDKKIIPILLNLLNDDNMWIKYFTLRTLGEIGDSSITQNLIKLLDDPIGIVKISALSAISKINQKIPLDIVLKLLKDDDLDVRVETIKYCIVQNYNECINNFIDMLNYDSNWRIKTAAIEALSLLGKETHTEILINLFAQNQSDHLICSTIFKNMGNMKNKKSFNFLMENSLNKEFSEHIFHSLLKFPAEYLMNFCQNFTEIAEEIQLIIIKLIANLKSDMFDDFLIKTINHVSIPVKYEIIICMDNLKRKKFLTALYPIAYPDKNIIKTAKKVLTNLKNLKV
ncbi:HEAT repeat domain-containing protein [Candidatus Dependentiae bacterium]|nr:HEAT repeat domain-containing protein [Candidatus Dependentiae bacterium]